MQTGTRIRVPVLIRTRCLQILPGVSPMATHRRTDLIDLLTTILLFVIALVGIYKSLEFQGRSGMWPTFVMVAMLVSVGVHLFNLFRKLRQPEQDTSADNVQQSEG